MRAGADRYLLIIQAIVLVLVNLIPLYGVFALGWSQTEILLVYWSETAIIGVYNVLKMLFSFGAVGALRDDMRRKLDPKDYKLIGVRETGFGIDTWAMFRIPLVIKVFFIAFFILHFGIFLFIFLGVLFAVSSKNASIPEIKALLDWMVAPLSGFFVIHGISFIFDYMSQKEQSRPPLDVLMFSPYGRIIVMVFILVVGAVTGIPVLGLVIAKTTIDLVWFWWEHEPRDRYLNIPIDTA